MAKSTLMGKIQLPVKQNYRLSLKIKTEALNF